MGRLFGASILPRPYLGPLPIIAAPSGMLITLNGPASTGPWAPNPAGTWPFGFTGPTAYEFGGQTSGGTVEGSLDAGSGLVNGINLQALGWCSAPDAFVVVLGPTGGLPQNFFNSIIVGAPISLTLATAAASYFNSNDPVNGFANYTVWAWAHPSIGNFQQVTVNFT